MDSNVFLTLNKLKILDLSTNNLIVLTPQNFVHLSSLDTLNLRGNPIMCASPDAFYQLQKLQTLLVSPLVRIHDQRRISHLFQTLRNQSNNSNYVHNFLKLIFQILCPNF